VLGNGIADSGVYVVGGEDGAVHESAGKVGERRVHAVQMSVACLVLGNYLNMAAR
jgi:hypothetical protein